MRDRDKEGKESSTYMILKLKISIHELISNFYFTFYDNKTPV